MPLVSVNRVRSVSPIRPSRNSSAFFLCSEDKRVNCLYRVSMKDAINGVELRQNLIALDKYTLLSEHI